MSKLDGTHEWTKFLTTDDGRERGGYVGVDNLGNVIVCANTYGSFGVSPGVGRNDVAVVKLDSDGEQIWAAQLASTEHDYCNRVAIDEDDNIYVTGRTNGELPGQRVGQNEF